MGPQEADPAVARAEDVPLRALPRLQQGGQGQQWQGQVPLQDEDAGKSFIRFCYIFCNASCCFIKYLKVVCCPLALHNCVVMSGASSYN